MASVFKKLLRMEFGKERYQRYSSVVRRSLQTRGTTQPEVRAEMYELLQGKDLLTLGQMYERLNDTMLSAFHISKSYGPAVFSFLTALYLLAAYTVPQIGTPLMVLAGILFAGKTYQFVINKFSYIDVHLTLIYKAVLDQILEGGKTDE